MGRVAFFQSFANPEKNNDIVQAKSNARITGEAELRLTILLYI